ncbi:MAG: sulfurtransferase-like selenium metabolism protein YedF [Spirochaetaceae bacterium]|jgi:selenium metabolism protein YedF|nr:sulfurtransferase-like selenium metabolism protein YedF [Spirochaetaceae bacterium]
MKTLDMRGNPCPIPVVNAKKALAKKEAEGVAVWVDNIVAVQNLEKMAKGTGCDFSYEETAPSEFKVTIVKGADSQRFFNEQPAVPEGNAVPTGNAGNAGRGPVVLITSDSMGRGADELGKLLIKGFIFSLTQLNPLPEAVIFLNGGAHLTTKGANTVPDLKALEEKGVSICTCGTCANYYKLTESLAVGSIVDMMNITNRLSKAALVITL